jgi:hypothetical protein
MFRALICSSSGGTVYTAIGIFCVYYVGWLLVGLEWNSVTGPTGCTICFQFITINSLYMFRALVCSSSGGTVYTAIGIFCVYYVGWLLAGLE